MGQVAETTFFLLGSFAARAFQTDKIFTLTLFECLKAGISPLSQGQTEEEKNIGIVNER